MQEVNISIVQSNPSYQSEKLIFSVKKKKKAKNKNTASQIKELQIETTRRIAFSPLELTKF